MLYSASYKTTWLLGRAARWYAQAWPHATSLERVLMWPQWAICRGVFCAGYRLTVRLAPSP